MKISQKLIHFFCSPGGVFLLGAGLAALFFGVQFGFAIVNPLATEWIWHGVAHDTAQHFIGWEFFRADGSGATINGLAGGLPLTFMDAIPLLAIPLGFFRDILPENFQYFGAWALLCYILVGGFAAVLMRKIWHKIFNDKILAGEASPPLQSPRDKSLATSASPSPGASPQTPSRQAWQILFAVAGALIFIVSPMMLARTLYHPALAAHWLILIAILLVWNAPNYTKVWKFIMAWSAMLVGAVLIHPYFLPMLGAMMLVAALRNIAHFTRRDVVKLFIKIIVPVALAGAIFCAIGGFAIAGSTDEFTDLNEKGFNLLSFANPYGYSALIPGFPNASSSPETMMWLGLGVCILLILAAIYFYKNCCKLAKDFRERYFKKGRISRKSFATSGLIYREKFVKKLQKLFTKKHNFRAGFFIKKLKWRAKFGEHFLRNLCILIVAICLLIFAIGIRVDLGPITLFEYAVPRKIYEIWSAFRAAAREAWPFYYATILAIIYWFALGMKTHFDNAERLLSGNSQATFSRKVLIKNNRVFAIVAILLFIISTAQFADFWFSEKVSARREGFTAAVRTPSEFPAPEISSLVTTQKNLVMLDAGFRGDQSGTYKIAQTALANNLTLNIGFFARIPEQIWLEQTAWREKISAGNLSEQDLRDNIFATRDKELAANISQYFHVEKRGDFWFVTR